MTPRSQEQFEVIRESRRLQIMEAALQMFASEGYGHCSMAMLAAHAGISKGLIYNYFESKEALLAAIIEHGLTGLIDLFDPDHDGVLDSGEFESFVRKVFSTMRGHQEFWVLYINVILQPKVRENLKDKPIIHYLQQYFSMLMVYLEKKGYEDPYLEVMTLSALIEGFGMLLIYTYPDVEFPPEMMDKFENRIIEMYT